MSCVRCGGDHSSFACDEKDASTRLASVVCGGSGITLDPAERSTVGETLFPRARVYMTGASARALAAMLARKASAISDGDGFEIEIDATVTSADVADAALCVFSDMTSDVIDAAAATFLRHLLTGKAEAQR